MRLVIQRTKEASVSINGKIKGQIEYGLVVLIGIEHEDQQQDADWLIGKIINMRIFSDDEGKMNLSIKDVNGQFLIISQFTLFASTKKGNRPSYTQSAKPEIAIPLYEYFIEKLRKESNLRIETGEFGADMQVALINDGPVTICMDSKLKI